VHVRDAGRLVALATEQAPAGAAIHAAAEEGVPTRAIAEAIGRGLGVPAKSIAPDEAGDVIGGFLGLITQLDNPTSSARTRELLGWKPTHADLLADIREGHYFASTEAKSLRRRVPVRAEPQSQLLR
jgi:nucleoside-diphosphate-sugar epimerase